MAVVYSREVVLVDGGSEGGWRVSKVIDPRGGFNYQGASLLLPLP